ncbi:MAG: galactokinase [Pleurocapsa minor GSE-CHR-MK-17-07R]|jgi:galactokinase|nr:galactokinase [Pleurocapsa minor GSE-CHR-MK 17-07R]
MTSTPLERARHAFHEHFNEPPTIAVRAPGRVNLIGEHTDYNDGFVMPMAIDRGVYIVLRPRTDGYVVAYSADYHEMAQFDPHELVRGEVVGEMWAEYLKGVAWALGEAGYPLHGWEGAVAGDVPMGAGLSSSAAIELATARAFHEVSGFDWHPATIARLCQKCENQWVGVNSGIMDQMISASGQPGHAVLIDCRSLETTPVPLPEDTVAVIMDTSTRRELVTSAYNERRAQCEAAAAHFAVKALRDVSVSQFEARADELDEVVRKRARHIVTENDRTERAAKAMQAGDAALLGQLMNQSHDSLRDDFEVTNEALNVIVDIARAQAGCFGARMTGAGFGGCAVALVAADKAAEFATHVSQDYHKALGLTANIYISPATAGASRIEE